jgi:hypothetical protein
LEGDSLVVYVNKRVTKFAWAEGGKAQLSCVRLSINPSKIRNWFHTVTMLEYYSYIFLLTLKMELTPYLRWGFRMPDHDSCSQRNRLLLNFVSTGNTHTHTLRAWIFELGFFVTNQLAYKTIRTLTPKVR